MKPRLAVLLLVSCLNTACAIPSPIRPGPQHPDDMRFRRSSSIVEPGDSLTLAIGFRSMTDDRDWGDLDDQVSGGIEYWKRISGDWIGLSFGAILGYADDSVVVNSTTVELESYTTELYFGPRVHLPVLDPVRLHAGFGATMLYSDAEFVATQGATAFERSDTDFAFGGYGQAGLDWFLNRSQSIGVAYRTVFGTDADLLGTETTLDYESFDVTFTAVF